MRDDESRDARAEIARQLETARAHTLALFDLVPREADLHASPGFGFRPLIWHLAHAGVFEAYWVLQKVKGERAPDERYERVFDPIATPREESKELPARREMEDYLARVRSRVLDYLATAPFDSDDPLLRDGYVFRLVLEHERQHQETLAYLLQLVDPAKKARPATPNGADEETARLSSKSAATHDKPATAASAEGTMIEVPAGEFEMGAAGESGKGAAGGFVYDNESPAHEVFVPAFKIDRRPVTNEEFARFVAEGGYERREFWGAEGWAWRAKEGWQHPLYWSPGGGGASSWRVRGMFEEAPLPPGHPVTGVSWYEAEAYARSAGKRLPTEAEWEKAAAWDDGRGRKRLFAWGDAEPTAALCNSDFRFWGTTPVGSFAAGASAAGCLDMTGNVWEWTSSKFTGYPGFRAFPYPEYSELWFDADHRVLRGGSWATHSSILRTSFRNFFRRHFRIAFAGLRCAADV
ncbi:MAG TPA: ergothioneine biosynthesis protein EgtB [Pyrinomonadaceae bacterium]|jgi:iron(II)-dependent oxidoreductase|nr:ergothioneine biosynthesis protein EgtB [Pyrinomonadaceae bacterium]